MPKLRDPRITKGHAASFLIRLYLQEPEFYREFCQVHRNHAELLAELVLKEVEFLVNCKGTFTTEEYHKMVRDFYESVATQSSSPALPANLACQLEGIKQIYLRLGQYFNDLEQLASRWKLKAPWAGPMLHLYHTHDCLKELGIPDTIDVPLDQLDLLYPWPPPVAPLEIKVSAWAFVLCGRKQIQADIAERVKDYEDRLKALGLTEYPSSLEKHARWWFEYFVHDKKYDDIAQEEAYTPGGSSISYARNVGDAVRRFSRLIGIDAKNLRSNS
jgi:hypothetical protein